MPDEAKFYNFIDDVHRQINSLTCLRYRRCNKEFIMSSSVYKDGMLIGLVLKHILFFQH